MQLIRSAARPFYRRIFGPYQADRLLAEHVFEHLITAARQNHYLIQV